MEEFLKELTELSKKHGYYIGGCVCCGSPWVSEFNNTAQRETGKYTADDNGDGLGWDAA